MGGDSYYFAGVWAGAFAMERRNYGICNVGSKLLFKRSDWHDLCGDVGAYYQHQCGILPRLCDGDGLKVGENPNL